MSAPDALARRSFVRKCGVGVARRTTGSSGTNDQCRFRSDCRRSQQRGAVRRARCRNVASKVAGAHCRASEQAGFTRVAIRAPSDSMITWPTTM